MSVVAAEMSSGQLGARPLPEMNRLMSRSVTSTSAAMKFVIESIVMPKLEDVGGGVTMVTSAEPRQNPKIGSKRTHSLSTTVPTGTRSAGSNSTRSATTLSRVSRPESLIRSAMLSSE